MTRKKNVPSKDFTVENPKEPEDLPDGTEPVTPPESNPPPEPSPAPPEDKPEAMQPQQLLGAILEGLKPTFEQIQNEFNKVGRTLEGQQKQIEDLQTNMVATVEDRVARMVAVVKESVPGGDPSQAQYLNPQQAAQQAPQPQAQGLQGMIQQAINFVPPEVRMNLLDRVFGGQQSDPGVIKINVQEVFLKGMTRTLQEDFNLLMRRRFGEYGNEALNATSTTGTVAHTVVGDHV